jgi:hypothetical protein
VSGVVRAPAIVNAAAAIHIQSPAFHCGRTKQATSERHAMPIGWGSHPATLITPIAVKKTAMFVRTTVDVATRLDIQFHLGYDSIQICNDTKTLTIR